MHEVRAAARFEGAVGAVAELLGKLRIDAMFVGRVAESAWLGEELTSGPIDVIAVMNPEQKNQVAMMASHRGFRVEREEIEAAEELDLVPLHFADAAGDVRVHVLLASNALYGRMVAAAKPARIGGREIRIPQAEDLALLLMMGDADEMVGRLTAVDAFDQAAFHDKLISIGLRERVTPR